MSQIYERAITQAMEQIAERDARIERLQRKLIALNVGKVYATCEGVHVSEPSVVMVFTKEQFLAVTEVELQPNDLGGEELGTP